MMVIDVLTLSSGMPSNSTSMSAKLLIGTPVRPTSPCAMGWSESYPVCVGRSNATLSPVCPCSSRYLYRRLDSSGDARPAYCRIVHSLPRYIVGCTPRVYGYSPG